MLIQAGLSCNDCGSSDALAQYENGTHCFSCGKTVRESSSQNYNWKPVSKTIEVPFATQPIQNGSRAHCFLMARHFTESLIEEYRIEESLCGDYLILTDSYRQFYEIRYLGTRDEPKYRTIGTKKKLFRSNFVYFQENLIICEDILSCMRVGQARPTVALRGTSLSEETISEFCIMNTKNYFTWFDSDEPGQQAAKKFKEKLQWLGTGFCNIITEKDPKWYTDSEIQDILQKVGYYEI